MEYEFKYPTEADALYIVEHMRDDNRQELIACVGSNAEKEMLHTLHRSKYASCCYMDGKPMAMFGIIPKSPFSSSACLWTLMTSDALEHKVFVGRWSKNVVHEALRAYSVLYNYVNIENTGIIKWLRWLGADLKGPVAYGVYRRAHYYFEFKDKGLI